VATARFYADATRAGLGLPAGWAMVRAVGVRREARGTGLGAALMAASADRARAAGVPVLALHTADFMTAAKRLYQGLGYRRRPEHDFVVGGAPDLGGAAPIVIRAYALELAPANTG
jgi:GNAT superfamily N-acetyltransferase